VAEGVAEEDLVYITTQEPPSFGVISGLRSFSISATTPSKMRSTFSLCLADDSTKVVEPHDLALASPSSRVTCLTSGREGTVSVVSAAARLNWFSWLSAYLWTAKSDLFPTSTIGTLSLPV